MAESSESMPKRKRLSFACNYCRARKTRCDEEQPCRNCRIAGADCVTTDKRRDGKRVDHRRRNTLFEQAHSGAHLPSPTAQQHTTASTSPHLGTPRTPDSYLPASTNQDHPRVFSPAWGPEGWKSGRLPMMPRLVGSSNLELMTAWLDMAFFRLKGPKLSIPPPLMNNELGLMVPNQVPEYPQFETQSACVASYLDTVHKIFPFLDKSDVELWYNTPTVPLNNTSEAPQQALKYLVVALGMLNIKEIRDSRSMLSSYISYCSSLLGYITSIRGLESIQAILLFSILLRSCDRITWAWDILTMGISMAQSIGINQTRARDYPSEEPEFRTWWSMYVFEKILALECVRPSTIWDRQLSGALYSSLETGPNSSSEEFPKALLSLANMFHDMQERSARAWRREEWNPQTVEEAINDKLQTAGELHMMLAEWQNSLPGNYRPGCIAALDLTNEPQFAFLSFYYYLGVIIVNRSTLIVPKTELKAMVDKYISNKAWRQSLLSGPSLVIEASRQMIKLFITLADSGISNYITISASPLIAIYALIVHIFQEPNSLLTRSDFELIKAALKITRGQYNKHGATCNIDDILSYLELHASQGLGNALSDLSTTPTTSMALYNDIMSETPRDATSHNSSNGSYLDPNALDWIGWDWNDLSHLFQHNE